MSNEKSVSCRRKQGVIRFRVELAGDFLLLLSLTWFFCGTAALLSLLLAAAVHELGHAGAILAQGDLPRSLRMDAGGLCIRCPPAKGESQEQLRVLAGPVSGLLLGALLCRSPMPFLRMIALTSLSLSAVNLLPASCLDGGRLLYSVGARLFGVAWADGAAAVLDWACILLFALLGIRVRWGWLLWSAWLLYNRVVRN